MSLLEDVEEELEGSAAQRLEPSDLYDPCVIGLGYRFNDGPLLVYSILHSLHPQIGRAHV